MSPRLIGVVGAGTMGVGVAHLFAGAGHEVVLVDVAEDALDRATRQVAHDVRFYPLVQSAFPRRDPDEVLARIRPETDPAALAGADVVFENATELWTVKEQVHDRLAAVCRPDCLIGVNTSAIAITRVGSRYRDPARVVGTHFMNPAPLKPLVEVIRGFHTSAEAVAGMTELLAAVGKRSVVVNDSPGFVTNRVMMLTVNEAVFLLQDGVAGSAADIDLLFRDCFGHRMGPLATADLIGLDTVLLSLEVLQDSFADCKYRPAPLLRTLVHAGRLGRKTGHGFHRYPIPAQERGTDHASPDRGARLPQ